MKKSMVNLIRTDSSSVGFLKLVELLDRDLAILNGAANDFFAQYNRLDVINHVVIAEEENEALGCGAMKEIEPGIVEIKRMFVLPNQRGRGVAFAVLNELELWAKQSGYYKCVLETGLQMPEAIELYRKSGYRQIANYGPYVGVESSVCFEKLL